jgi:hypothetical protein
MRTINGGMQKAKKKVCNIPFHRSFNVPVIFSGGKSCRETEQIFIPKNIIE